MIAHWSRCGCAVVLVVGACIAGAATPKQDATPTEWLDAMGAAMRSIDFDGVFSHFAMSHEQWIGRERDLDAARDGRAAFNAGYRSSFGVSTFRVVYKVSGELKHVRIVQLDGERRETVRHGDALTLVYMPGDALFADAGAPPAMPYARIWALRFQRMADCYSVDFDGRDRVAGRDARALLITPCDRHRFGYRLLLDANTAMLLRFDSIEMRDGAGRSVEIFQFHTLRTGGIDEADLEPEAAGAQVRRVKIPRRSEDAADAADTESAVRGAPSHWHIGWVPPGFRLLNSNVHRQADADGDNGARDIETLMFSDGLAAFSVFIEPVPETGAGSVVSQSGATVALTWRVAGGAQGQSLVSVVGEVPVATAHRIATSVQPRR